MTWNFPHTGIWWANVGLMLFQLVSVIFIQMAIWRVRAIRVALKNAVEEASTALANFESLKKKIEMEVSNEIEKNAGRGRPAGRRTD